MTSEYGLLSVQTARQLARKSGSLKSLPHLTRSPVHLVPFRSLSNIEQGQLVQFEDVSEGWGLQGDDDQIWRTKNQILHNARIASFSDTSERPQIRRKVFGVSISNVGPSDSDTLRTGAAIVSGPAIVECVVQDATAESVGNFIVPGAGTNQGMAELRPYGIAHCVEEEPSLEGWKKIIMGQQKWNFIGKTVGDHNKGVSQAVAVYYGDDVDDLEDTGLTQVTYNRYDDVTDDIWVGGDYIVAGFELVNAEC